MQLHLLDATYELFRAHFGRPPHADADGKPVGATLGVVESVLSLLREDGVTHIGCATDHVIRSWRNERYAGYKTDAGMPPELLAQFPLAEDALRAIGCVVWPMVEFEADDALAAAAERWADDPGVERVVILTPDKDMAQCVREDGRIVTYDRRKRQFMDADGVRAKFGVRPESIADFLALVGDAADGYPGIPGWGAVSTAAVLRRYPHLEDIPESVRGWDVSVSRGAATLAASLREHRAEALLFRELASLRTDAPTPQRRRTSCAGEACPRESFAWLADRLNEPALRFRVPRWQDGATVTSPVASPGWAVHPAEFGSSRSLDASRGVDRRIRGRGWRSTRAPAVRCCSSSRCCLPRTCRWSGICVNARVGAATYNAVHGYAPGIVLAFLGWWLPAPLLPMAVGVLIAHDRHGSRQRLRAEVPDGLRGHDTSARSAAGEEV